jgi:hypothetical protein
MNEAIPPDTVCFDHSQMSGEERERVQGLQKLLELDSFADACTIEMGVIHAIRSGAKKPYDGWFSRDWFAQKITGDKRGRLIEYIEQTKQAGIYE